MPIEKNKILNPKTGRLVLKTSALGKKILKEMNDSKELKKKPKNKEIKLKDGYEIINGKLYKLCKDGQIRNPKTNRCIKNKNKEIEKEVIEVNEEIQEEDDYKDANEEFEEEEVKINLNNFYTYLNEPLNYEFNKSNVKKFLDACDDETRPIAKKIIDNTKHVTFKEMIKLLNLNLKELIELSRKDRPLFIYINKSQGIESSNYWIYLYLKDFVHFYNQNQEIIVITNKIIDNSKLKNDDIIVMLDNINDIEKLINKNNLKLNIFILASFISKKDKYLMNDDNKKNLKIILNSHYSYIPNINDYLNTTELQLLISYYSYYNSLNSHYNINYEYFTGKHLIYYDHKLGNTDTTIPLFYSGIVPNSYNKKLFNENSDIPENLEIIPLLRNCENVRNTRRYNPECPISPYKDNIDDIFIEKKVINSKTKSKSNILLDLWKKIKF